MARELSYASSGVNRNSREKAKKFDLFAETLPNGTLRLPFNNLLPDEQGGYYLLSTDGIGTKVLIAQLADKHDTIGIDGVAMVANDAIRCGATPIDVVNAIDVHHSEPELLSEILKGIKQGALKAGCRVVGGETADVPLLINGISDNPYHANFSCYARVEKKDVIDAKNVKATDAVVGLRSSGLHSNGISLARRALFKEWGGAFDTFDKPDELEQELVFEALTPTEIYAKDFLQCAKEYEVKAAVHITGDAFMKFKAISKYSPVGFSFDNFSPQPIFSLIQKAAEKIGSKVSNQELFRTFNMGWGFALIVSKEDADCVCDFFNKKQEGFAEVIGKTTAKKAGVEISYNGNTFSL
ncbi:MAG: phosphoribosylformylglycinamidine cyclo-ligase [Candidatus Micrarchaeia archaeon]